MESDPLQLAERLDTYLKLKIFDHQVTRTALAWATLRQALEVLEKMRRSAPETVMSVVVSENGSGLDKEQAALCRQLSRIARPLPAGGLLSRR